MITVNLINEWGPCYDPTRYLNPEKTYTVADILDHPEIPDADKLWVTLRSKVLDDKTLRLFAVKCAREVLKPDADPRSHKALEVAERFAYGKASKEELGAAWAAAWAAARDAALDAADAARAAARAHQVKMLREMVG